MRRRVLGILLSLFFAGTLPAQMWNGIDTLYGNEWIDFEQPYFRIQIAEDGIYRIPYESLQNSGLPVASIGADQYQLWQLGEEQPLYTSTSGPLGAGDYLEFYGRKNRSELDRYLFQDPDGEMLNPWYSLITDTAAYYLTWAPPGTATLRYESLSNDLSDPPAKELWYWSASELAFTDTHAKQSTRVSGTDIYYSGYDEEGFASAIAKNHSFALNSSGSYGAAPDASLELRFLSGNNSAGHQLEVHINGQLMASQEFAGSRLLRYDFPLPASLGDEVEIEINGLNNNDRYWVGGAHLRYPHDFQLDGTGFAQLELPPAPGPRYLEVANLVGVSAAVLLDLSNRQRLLTVWEGGFWKAQLPAAAGSRQLVLAASIRTVGQLEPVSFTDYSSLDADYLIISHQRLFDDGQGADWVQAYADYRSSQAGGGYRVAVVDIRQLYEQFAYGLNHHPLSVRNFVHYLQHQGANLRYCFLIGKGQEFQDVRKAAALQEAIAEGRMLVPSYGNPASDHLLLAHPGSRVPIVPVGRLSVTGGAEIRGYLDKVKALEANIANPQTIDGRAWMKQAIHLGGGSSTIEQDLIKDYLEVMADELEGNIFGGKVSAFYRASTDPIETSQTEQIFERINNGLSIISFFGHSTPGTFDFNIDNPDNYDNYGKYPLMLSLGCYSGDIFNKGQSIGERFISYENKAAVAFGASRGVGFVSSLGPFARSFYSHFGGDYYGQGIGDALRATLQDYAQNPFIGTATLVEQFTLQGDPAIRLHPAPGPDYTVDPASVQFEPRVATAQSATVRLSFQLLNLGRHTGDTIALLIRQQLPAGDIREVKRDTITGPAYGRSLSYELPIQGKEAIGLNTFFITVDADDTAAELPAAAEFNNELQRPSGELGAPLFVVDNSARPIYPPQLALVSEAPITLKASTTDALAPERTYILELDTTARFDSPTMRRTAITQRGGLIEWMPSLPWQDSTAYYWRISPDSTDAEVGYTWERSSFTYINGSPNGWGQGHYWQWLEGEPIGIAPVEGGGFDFLSSLSDLRVRNQARSSATFFTNGNGWANMWIWQVSGLEAGVQVVVLDPADPLHFWINHPPGQAGSVNNKNFWVPQFSFPTRTPEERLNLMNFLSDSIPDGHYVGLYTGQKNATASFQSEDWEADSLLYGNNLFGVLEEEGANQVRALADSARPYVFFYKKGYEALKEGIAPQVDGIVDITQGIPKFLTEGALESPAISGSSQWGSLTFDWQGWENEDKAYLSLFGSQEAGQWFLLRDSITASPFDLQDIDAAAYPMLKLRLFAEDAANRSPVILNNWRVFNDGLPDFAIDPSRTENTELKDTIQEGAAFIFRTNIEKVIAGVEFQDSIRLLASLVDAAGKEVSEDFWVNIAEGTDTEEAVIQLPTLGLKGATQYSLLLNPEQEIEELFYFNNNLAGTLFIEEDKKNPILDVTFDGKNIFEGEIVSASPDILITLTDENPYLLLSDTALFVVELMTPNATQPQRLNFNSEEVTYLLPQEGQGKNRAEIRWQPTFTESGNYRLIVAAEDRTSNMAGTRLYEKSFEVITEKTISRVFNYPNPFSTSTHFVYTLTGDQDVDRYKIMIMTVSGRVVRELTGFDLGPLKVGTHQTDFGWDGTDTYGDRLANGVYLYRVVIDEDREGVYEDRTNASTERFFKNGFGKLVILR